LEQLDMNMKRREFARLTAVATLVSAGVAAPLAWAQVQKPQAGTDYQRIDPPAPVDAPSGKVEVVEFFWYNCSHCNAFEPALEAWIKKLPKDVVMRRVPVAFQTSFAPQQRLYYALEAMGLVDTIHSKVFAAIHGEKIKLETTEAIADWVARQGVDRAKFLDQFNSFSVATKATRATQLQNAYKIEGVPALGVAGRFYTDGTIARSMPRALQIADALIVEARARR
jgi:thiol:disulfide interchange protein DsbA